MNTKLAFKINTNYHLELIDAASGKIKQSGDFHNLTTDNIGAYLSYVLQGSSAVGINPSYRLPYYIHVGSGTTPPSPSDTALASELWYSGFMYYETVPTDFSAIEWVDDYTGRISISATFPATSEYVGVVTEVALYGVRGRYSSSGGTLEKGPMATRALLTDSEGQQISFNKTDTDILSITVTFELSVSSISQDFTLFKKCLYISKILAGDPYAYNLSNFGYLNLVRFHRTCEEFNGGNVTIDKALTNGNITGTWETGNRSAFIQYPVNRLLATEITDERYYKAIAQPRLGYFKLPNESVFPAYTISNIAIGTGDGVTTSFDNPFSYFKKDSEKVYKNGVQLVRGTDYTINHIGNRNCLPEVAEFNLPTKVRSEATSVTTLNGWIPLLTPMLGNYDKSGVHFFSDTNPLYFEYDEPVTMNCFKSNGAWYNPSGTNGYNNATNLGYKLFIEYSTDGVNYTEIANAPITTEFSVDFANTTAKYWRLRTNYSGVIGMMHNSSTIGHLSEYYTTLNFKDPYIVFAEAPAEGDAITMDVDMDIIMKNSNFVVDVGARFDISW